MRTYEIILSKAEHDELNRRLRSSNVDKRDKRRARVILLAAQGCTRAEIALLTDFSLPVITRWCHRFLTYRLDGLIEKPGRGRKPVLSHEVIKQVIEYATDPTRESNTWSYRALAKKTGISLSSVHRILSANSDSNLPQERQDTPPLQKNTNDQYFDVVGLLLTHQEKIVVICYNNNKNSETLRHSFSELLTLIEATQTHQSVSDINTTNLLSRLQERINISDTQRNLNQDILNFLEKIEQETPKNFNLLILKTNNTTTSQLNLASWIEKRKRFTSHSIHNWNSWPAIITGLTNQLSNKNQNKNNFKLLQSFIDSAGKFVTLRNVKLSLYVWHADKNKIQSTRYKFNRTPNRHSQVKTEHSVQ